MDRCIMQVISYCYAWRVPFWGVALIGNLTYPFPQ